MYILFFLQNLYNISRAKANKYTFLSHFLFTVTKCRTDDPAASRELLRVLGIDKCFQQLEIFPSKKFAHFDK